MKPPPTQRNAFTLIELLVVVAIIVALLAILMPSMGRAIDQAQTTVCMSNLHQSGLAILNYVADYFMVTPPPLDYPAYTNDDYYTWSAILWSREYMPDSKGMYCPLTTADPAPTSIKGTKQWTRGTAQDKEVAMWSARFTYGKRVFDFDNYLYSPTPVKQVQTPADYVLVTDCSDYTWHSTAPGGAAQFAWFDPWHGFYLLHQQRANTLLLDLSSRSQTEEELNGTDYGVWQDPASQFVYP